jgi:hypothetical protein
MVVVYSVSGSIGLDRIQVQSFDIHGSLIKKEILTGNLTTQLVLQSAHDVNVTVLPLDGYYSSQRRFLLYFYIVPKCYLILCPNITVYPQNTRPITSYVVAETTTIIYTAIMTSTDYDTESIATNMSTTTTPFVTNTVTKLTSSSYLMEPSTYDHRVHEHRPRLSGLYFNLN